ncbi:hypothetical protein CICLE_v10023149mg [Citrus x clementina]|uniref:Uncharacterized protein n=1 Tax=Citrus clementina TaxID=85681 RepID=V4TNG0_CITCL|nr:hypothetical protein CICLE_v10023149mg [Citrus x clementina]
MLGRLKLVEVAAVMMMRNHNLKDLNNSNEGHSLVNIIFSESTCNSKMPGLGQNVGQNQNVPSMNQNCIRAPSNPSFEF